jgi:hypothetical protein
LAVAKAANVTIRFGFAKEVQKRFIAALKADQGSLRKALTKFDVNDGQVTIASDRALIISHIEADFKGTDQFNEQIKAVIDAELKKLAVAIGLDEMISNSRLGRYATSSRPALNRAAATGGGGEDGHARLPGAAALVDESPVAVVAAEGPRAAVVL